MNCIYIYVAVIKIAAHKTLVMEKSKESAWKGSSPEDVTETQQNNKNAQSGKVMPSPDDTAKEQDAKKQGNTNKAMGNAANRDPQNPAKANRPGQDKMKQDDADEMGSGKRQDDN
jgi:hypothetical protein